MTSKSNASANSNAGYTVRRAGTRVKWLRPVIIKSESGTAWFGHTVVLSVNGVGCRVINEVTKNEQIKLFILIDSAWRCVPGKIAFCKRNPRDDYNALYDMGIEFENPNMGSIVWAFGKNQKAVIEAAVSALP